MKYFIYARKSTEDKAKQIQSIPDQVNALKSLAKERKLEIVDIIIDEKSAKAPGRNGFSKMVERIQRSEAEGILCWKMDRLARNTIDGGTLTWMLQTGKIKEILTPDKVYLPSENTLILSIEFGMATQFSRDLVNSVERGMQSKIEKGWYASKAPIGYINEKHANKGEKRILKDSPNFETIKHLWEILLKREYTMMQLYRYMKESSPIFQKDGKVLAFTTFTRIFRNPFYCGLFRWREKLLVGSHAPMITQQRFEQAQKILNREFATRERELIFDFKGLFKCGTCGAWITAEEHDKLVKTKQTRKKYRYYRCVHKKRDTECREKPLSEEKVFQKIESELKSMYMPTEALNFGFKKLSQIEKSNEETLKEKQLKSNLIGLKQKLKVLHQNIAEESDAETRSIMKDRIDELKVEIRNNEDALQEIVRTKDDPYKELKNNLQVIHRALGYLKEGSLEQKREVVRALGSNWIVKSQILDYEPNKVVRALKKTNQFVLGEKSRIELQKKQSRTASLSDYLTESFIWSA